MKITKPTSPNTIQVYLITLLCTMLSLLSLSFASKAKPHVIVVKETSAAQAVKGTFLQSKNIKPLKRPFKSAGDFIYYPTKGLLWHTQKPVQSLKLFANDGVYKLASNGELLKEAQLDNEFFLALFAADEEKLGKFFTTKNLSNDNAELTCLALTPLSDTMKSLFLQVQMCSKKHNGNTKIPTKITLIEAKGNRTDINFQLSNTPLTSKELAYFD